MGLPGAAWSTSLASDVEWLAGDWKRVAKTARSLWHMYGHCNCVCMCVCSYVCMCGVCVVCDVCMVCAVCVYIYVMWYVCVIVAWVCVCLFILFGALHIQKHIPNLIFECQCIA